ncbi:TerB family tellurite resistance protein [Mangrovibacterium diazotrophicum]|uniref:Putative tellurite resistance protein B-like protein n=1 Tax=Mangrovibacterium diazotrophicum TaxID=1261403 RepID=A0A419W3H0_9BACT|nr:TerB family tellurite resistance protein [Mangrovibacterium diazotrophicum]RKD90026.1 putative tellurite resistance protein B-like protein [Mangrovibacterium diazotrophicum]
MLKFLNKKKENSFHRHVNGFANGFSEEQKSAIIGSLFMMANADGSIHPREVDNVTMAAKLLEFNIDSKCFERVIGKGEREVIKILNTLDRSQKEWLIVSIHGMIFADGKIEDAEIAVALAIANSIGISEYEYEMIIKKTEFLMREFGM